MNHQTARTDQWMALLRWMSRIWSLLSIGLIVLFLVGEGLPPLDMPLSDWFGLMLFPVGVGLGMLIGWRNELIGGAITLLSLLAFYLIYGLWLNGRLPDGWAFLAFSAPGIGFYLLGILDRKKVEPSATSEDEAKARLL